MRMIMKRKGLTGALQTIMIVLICFTTCGKFFVNLSNIFNLLKIVSSLVIRTIHHAERESKGIRVDINRWPVS